MVARLQGLSLSCGTCLDAKGQRERTQDCGQTERENIMVATGLDYLNSFYTNQLSMQTLP